MQEINAKHFNARFDHLKKRLVTLTECPENSLNKLLSYFISEFKSKWQSSQRKKNIFLSKNKIWLDTEIHFPSKISTQSGKSRGRPSTSFHDSSDRSKRRKTEQLRTQYSPTMLSYAAQMSLRKSGNVDSAYVIKNITCTTPTRASKYKKSYKDSKNKIKVISNDEALSLLIEAQLTKHQYNLIRTQAKKHGCNIYPAYHLLRYAKNECYPDKSCLQITESCAEVKLQALLDITTQRILKSQGQGSIIDSVSDKYFEKLYLISKWGCDGSSQQSEYKQVFNSECDSDSSIFFTSVVPLQLVSGDIDGPNKIILWQNPRPSSPRYCRPIKIQFIHETVDITLQEKVCIENQIEKLQPSIFHFNDTEIMVKHILMFTMIDGKVCNSVTSTKSAMKCYICGSTSKDFNKIEKMIDIKTNDLNLKFGLSILHAWIRFFECLLHLSYKIGIKKWQARGGEEKRKVLENKKRIQEKFKSKLGLLVDIPKCGYGTSNDGNTARRFFENTEMSSSITGVDIEIINRFKIVLLTISSGYKIDLKKFNNYCILTAQKFVDKYPWYNMPTSVHKILIHGTQIIEALSILPIGQFSEESQEARNKDIKKYREGFSRKCSRIKNLEDVFNRLLVSSDPLISSLRQLPQKKIKHIHPEVLEMILPPDINIKTIKTKGTESDISSENEVSTSSSE